MRVIFFAKDGDNEPHLFDVEDMQVPVEGQSVWTNGIGLARDLLPPALHGHTEWKVVRVSYSVMFADNTVLTKYKPSVHAEVLLEEAWRNR